MNCKTVRTRLTALLDAELSARVVAQVRPHLESCPDCVRALEEERLLRTQAAAWSVESGDVWEAVREEIQREAHAEILTEVRRLQADILALRGEVALLRAQLTVRRQEGSSGPSPLLPCVPADRSTSVLM